MTSWNNRSAIERVGVFDDDAVIRAAGFIPQILQDLAGLFPAVQVFRRVHAASAALETKTGHDAAGAKHLVGEAWRADEALRLARDGFLGVRIRTGLVVLPFRHDRVERFDQRNVQHIHPDDRRIAVVAVIVPFAVRRDHEIATLKRTFFAADSCVGLVALQHETAGVGHVAVHVGDVIGVIHRHRR